MSIHPQASPVVPLPVPTQIIAVTVYPKQARVTRCGTVSVADQAVTLVIEELPGTLQTQSIQVQQRGTAKVTLGGVQVESVLHTNGQDPVVAELSDRIRQLEDAFRQAKDRLATLTLQREFLESLAQRCARTFALGLAQQQMGLDQVSELLAFLSAQHQTFSEALIHQERHKHTLDHQLQDARHALQELQGRSPETRYQVLIPLQIETPGALEIELSYTVDQASWEPLYNVRFGEFPDELQLDYLAQVQQQTGEPWEQVRLQLSTAGVNDSPAPPQPAAWYVNLPRTAAMPNETLVRQGTRSRSPILQDTYRMLGAMPGSEIPPGNRNEGDWNGSVDPSASAVIRYPVPQLATIPSDHLPYSVVITQRRFPSQLAYIALPQRSVSPYLQASLTNPIEGLPLLPGTARLYRAGGYIGQEAFAYAAPGQAFHLSLGLDDRLSIQRELVSRDRQEGTQCCDRWVYRLILHNPLTHPVQITVIERLPISQTDRIHIRLLQADPPTTLSEIGLCQWSLTLLPETTEEIQYGYTMEHPGDLPVLGLDKLEMRDRENNS